MTKRSWVPLVGVFQETDSGIFFKGEPTTFVDPGDPTGREQIGYAPGLAMSSDRFSGGTISADISFASIHPLSSCELIFYFDPARQTFLSAGISPPGWKIRQWDGKSSTVYAAGGDRRNLRPERIYRACVSVQGSRVRFLLDDVEVLDAVVPFAISPSQAGIYCFDDAEIRVSNFRVNSGKGRVFVVMEFSSPFNEIYTEVIKKVVEETYHLEVRRADEIYGPGVIIDDILRDIVEAEFVVAEISPNNPNVYYELGYARAIGKPVVMLVDKGVSKLPFDVASARALYYENSIPGKTKFENLLRKHIDAILEKSTLPSGGSGLTGR